MGIPTGVQIGLSALAGGGNIFDSIMRSKTARENTERTIQANKEMAEYAYSKDLEMWNRMNEYNAPSAQMQRFKDAGLNPVLMYGKGTAGAGQATTLPKYNAPRQDYRYQPIQTAGTIQAFQDVRMKDANIDYIREQANLANEKVQTEVWNRALKILGVDKGRQDMLFKGELHPYNIQMQQKLVDQAIQRINNLQADTENKFMQNKILDAQRQLAELHVQMREDGIEPGDAIWKRTVKDFLQGVKDWFKSQGLTWDKVIQGLDLRPNWW